jgi:predicted flap endonuclease-1-like 5' DNA nuclease/BMFP domain-containing protein YqiC
MVWLLSQIWLALGLAALFGGLIGWALRCGKANRVAAELNGRIETLESGLASAQTRTQTAESEAQKLRSALDMARRDADQVGRGAVAAATERANSLEAELRTVRGHAEREAGENAALRTEVADLKTRLEAATQTVASVAPAAAALSQNQPESEDLASVRWRNRYLESRVRFLESRLGDDSGSGGGAAGASLLAAGAVAAGGAALAAQGGNSAETEALKARVSELEGALAAAQAAPAGAPAVDAEAEAQAAWKLRYLEARVAYLQNKVDAPVAVPAPVPAPAPVVEAAPVVAAAVAPALTDGGAEDAEVSRLRWQNRYLEARVRYFETRTTEPAPATAEVVAAPAVVDTTELDTLRSRVVELEARANQADALRMQLATLEQARSANPAEEQEAARLRWRARYLEGRVKYLEGLAFPAAAPVVAAVVAEAPAAVSPAPAPVMAAEVVAAPVVEAVPEVAAPEPAAADEPSPVAVDADAALETNLSRPLALDGPRNGTPDDLKMIGGVGPKIEGILHELGIYHFDQVAAWTPEEAAWIDNYLRFKGRVDREQWIAQAQALAAGETTEAAQKYLSGEHS